MSRRHCPIYAKAYTQRPDVKVRRAKRAKAVRHADPRPQMIRDARVRATRDGVPMSITKDDITVPAHCPVLGIPLQVNSVTCAGSPSLDRLIPRLGYVPGNVTVISHRANRIKSDATFLEVVLLARWLERML